MLNLIIIIIIIIIIVVKKICPTQGSKPILPIPCGLGWVELNPYDELSLIFFNQP